MKKYEVRTDATIWYYKEVEANSEEEAIELAQEVDLGLWSGGEDAEFSDHYEAEELV